jgi:hypothetical protein
MIMAKFMLARGKKPNAYAGLKKVSRPGGLSDIVQKVEFPFYPGRAVDVPDDVDMSGWVENGHLIPIRSSEDEKKAAKEPMPPAPPAPPKPSVPTKPKPESGPDEVAPPGPAPELPKPEPEETPDYDELDDGSFQCLHCDKVYKTEKGIVKHVEDKHL